MARMPEFVRELASVAFQLSAARVALTRGETVESEDVRLSLFGGGIKAESLSRKDLGSHQAFWFAWSQFYPDTKLWSL